MPDVNDALMWALKFDVTRSDWIAFERLRATRVTIWLPVVAAIGALAGWHADRIEAGLPFAPGGWAASTAVGLLIGAGAFGAVTVLERFLCVRRAQRYPIGTSAIDVRESGLHWQLADACGNCRWADVRTVLATESHVYLVLVPDEVRSIPLRAFGSPGQMDAFAAWVRSRLKQADDT